MPLYEYVCENEECTVKTFEDYKDIEERDTTICPLCCSECSMIISNPTHYKHSSWEEWKK